MKPVAAASAPRLLFLLAVSLGGCHRNSAKPNPVPETGYVVGDTAAFAPRLLNVDQTNRRVTFEVNAPAYVLLVSVVPGESAVPVGAFASDRTLAEPGTHTMPVIAGQTGQTAIATLTSGSLDQQDYERCVSRGQRGMPRKRVVVTDSTGKPMEVSEPSDPRDEVEIERGCEAGVNRRARAKAEQPQSTPAANRFPVLLVSNMPMMLADAIERFEEMRNIPNDVPATISEVAAALYGDRKGIWSAYYIRW
jgi:hypothetical protein